MQSRRIKSAKKLQSWAESVLAVRDEKTRHDAANAASQARFQHAAALRFDQSTAEKQVNETEDMRIQQIGQLIKSETEYILEEKGKVSRDIEALQGESSNKIRLLRLNLANELRSIRQKLENDYQALQKELDVEFSARDDAMKQEFERSRIELQRKTEEHETAIANAHAVGIEQLRLHYASLTAVHNKEIAQLEKEVADLSNQRHDNILTIANLSDKNRHVLEPLERLEFQERKLLEQAQIADAGYMAYANFKETFANLQRELRKISQRVALIQDSDGHSSLTDQGALSKNTTDHN